LQKQSKCHKSDRVKAPGYTVSRWEKYLLDSKSIPNKVINYLVYHAQTRSVTAFPAWRAVLPARFYGIRLFYCMYNGKGIDESPVD
jgi:hypothetical protein